MRASSSSGKTAGESLRRAGTVSPLLSPAGATRAGGHEGTELSGTGGPGGSGTPARPGRDSRPRHGIALRGQLARVRGQLDQQWRRQRYRQSGSSFRQAAARRRGLRQAILRGRGVATRGQTDGAVLDEGRRRAVQRIQQHRHHRQRVLRDEPAVHRQRSGRFPHSEAEADSAGPHLREEKTHRRAAAYKETPDTRRYLSADMTRDIRGFYRRYSSGINKRQHANLLIRSDYKILFRVSLDLILLERYLF